MTAAILVLLAIPLTGLLAATIAGVAGAIEYLLRGRL